MNEEDRTLAEQERREQATGRMVSRLMALEYAPLLVKSSIEENRALHKAYTAMDYDEREKYAHYLMGAYHAYYVLSASLVSALDNKED